MIDLVIPEAAQRLSGIQMFGFYSWIPGSLTPFAPRNDGKGVLS
jgi:hypothetical protein